MSAGWFNAEKIKSKEAHAGGKNDLNVDWFILLMEPTCNTTINYWYYSIMVLAGLLTIKKQYKAPR